MGLESGYRPANLMEDQSDSSDFERDTFGQEDPDVFESSLSSEVTAQINNDGTVVVPIDLSQKKGIFDRFRQFIGRRIIQVGVPATLLVASVAAACSGGAEGNGVSSTQAFKTLEPATSTATYEPTSTPTIINKTGETPKPTNTPAPTEISTPTEVASTPTGETLPDGVYKDIADLPVSDEVKASLEKATEGCIIQFATKEGAVCIEEGLLNRSGEQEYFGKKYSVTSLSSVQFNTKEIPDSVERWNTIITEGKELAAQNQGTEGYIKYSSYDGFSNTPIYAQIPTSNYQLFRIAAKLNGPASVLLNQSQQFDTRVFPGLTTYEIDTTDPGGFKFGSEDPNANFFSEDRSKSNLSGLIAITLSSLGFPSASSEIQNGGAITFNDKDPKFLPTIKKLLEEQIPEYDGITYDDSESSIFIVKQ